MNTLMSVMREAGARAKSEDRGVALLSVLMLIMVITVLALIVLGVVLAQTSPTLVVSKGNRTLAAAQAGLDAATSQIRNATSPDATGAEMGDMHKLPCTVEGTVDSEGSRYTVSLAYYATDPETQDDAWRAANAITCYNGVGINGGLREVPRFALLTAEGFDDSATASVDRADRVIEATYTFQLTTRRVAGGMMFDDSQGYCLVADSAAVGSYIRYQRATSSACQTQSDLNSFSWNSDYMIHLSSSDLEGRVPLCLSGRASSSSTVPMTLQQCTTSSTDPLGQRYSWTGAHTWLGQNSANTGYGSSYIVNQDNSVGSGDRLSVSTSSSYKSITPMPAVGKGNASYLTNQVVNYQQFGRCLDVTDVNINKAYMIAYPCKQDPSGNGAFDWNHKWYYDEPAEGIESVSTKVTVRPSASSTYCLIATTTTGLVGQSNVGSPYYTSNYRFPKFVVGSTTSRDCTSANTTWTRYGYSESNVNSYTIQDRYGWCLSTAGPKFHPGNQWSSIITEPCDGSDEQKWNVPDQPVAASLSGFTELTAGTDG